MSNNLIVAIHINSTKLSRMITGLLKETKGVETSLWSADIAENSTAEAKSIPDIILIDDNLEAGDLITRIHTLKKQYPKITIFVVSDNKDPQYIIAAMKAGAAEYLVEPIQEAALRNAMDEVRAKIVSTGGGTLGRIYSFVSAKGGVGSTVLAVNTAATFTMNKKATVALIDMSFQSGDASVLLDIVPQNTITDICLNMHRFDIAFLRSVLAGHSTGINFLAAPLNPEDSEDIKGEHISTILNLIRKLFDHIILDCGSMHFNDCTIEAFKQSDKVFVVTDMSVPSIRNTVRFCKMARKLDINFAKIEIVINRFIKGGALSLDEIEKNFEKKVYWLVPNDFSNIVSSINRGVPLVKLSPGAPVSKNVHEFTKKIQGILNDQNFRGIKGSFGKNF